MTLKKKLAKEIESEGFGNVLSVLIEVLEERTVELDHVKKHEEAREVEKDILYLEKMSQNR